MSFTVYPVSKPHLESGRIRALAVTTAKRSPALPNIPAIAETVPKYEINTWYGIVAPARTPAPILEWLHREVSAIMQQPAIKQALAADATDVMVASREEFGKLLGRETAKWREIVRQAGVTNQ